MIKNITLGQFFPGNSIVHRLDARIKLVLAVAVIVLIFLVKTLIGYAVVLGFFVITMILSRISVKYVLRGLKPLWFILIFTFVLNTFFIQAERSCSRGGSSASARKGFSMP